MFYRHAGSKKDELRVRRLLDPLKKKAAESMPCITTTLDMKPVADQFENQFKHKSLQEKIMILAKETVIYKKDEVQEDTLKYAEESLSSSLFGVELINSEGKRVINMPPIDLANPTANKEVLELHMYWHANQSQSIVGVGLNIALDMIRSKHKIEVSDLDFLIDNNAIIPNNQKNIFKRGVYQGLLGNNCDCILMLVPLIENLFRELARECGGIVTTFEDNTTEQAKTLSSVFDTPELVESYDENILFTFRGLLNEKAGANLRNRAAHGLINENEINNGVNVYFLCLIIKLLSFYSCEASEIYSNLLKNEDAPSVD